MGSEADSQACNMFWDVVVDRFRDTNTPTAAEIFQALERQLSIPNRYVQLSALHASGHLKDARCRPIIAAFQRACGDQELVDYASGAMTFSVL